MLTSPMATDDEDLARQQYESSGRKKGKKHKKDLNHFRIDWKSIEICIRNAFV